MATIIDTLEVWPRDLGKMTWDEATQKVKRLGEGWRLPTKEEFENILYPNKSKIPNLKTEFYWSSTENDIYNVWPFNFTNGNANYTYHKFNSYYVRAVRDFSGEIALELLLKDF